MADGIQIGSVGVEDAIRKLIGIGTRLGDAEPVFRLLGGEIEKRNKDGFTNARSQFGVPFEPLKESTIRARISKLRAANKRTKSGALTKGAQRKRERLRAPVVRDFGGGLVSAGMTPMTDTGRAKNEQNSVAGPQEMKYSVLRRLLPHMVGARLRSGAKLPMRNPTVFVRTGGGGFDFLGGGGGKSCNLDPSTNLYFRRLYSNYVLRGKAAV